MKGELGPPILGGQPRKLVFHNPNTTLYMWKIKYQENLDNFVLILIYLGLLESNPWIHLLYFHK